ncbi:hypothetical protein HYY74_01395 [Candidatus Woesearchaeota archaeon]|nr:hypothetical protein [Candidatus Woesearchaeota archaeon]
MDRKASKIFFHALITLALAVPVLAQGPADLIGPFSNFNIGGIYDKFGLFIDFLLYTALFVGVSKFALEKHFESTPAVPIVIGLVLAISTSVFAYRVGFRIVNLGPYALLVGLAMLIIAVYQMFRGFGINIPNAAAMGFVIGWAVFSAAGGTFIDQIPEDSQLRTVFAFGNILWLVGLIFLLISLFKLLTAGEEPPKQEGGGETQQQARQQQAQQAQQRQAQEEQAQRERARAGELAQDGARQAGPQAQPATMRPRTFPQFRPAPVQFPMPGGPGRPLRMPPIVMPFWVAPGTAGAAGGAAAGGGAGGGGIPPGGAGASGGGGGAPPIGGGGGGAPAGPPPPPIAGGALPTPGFFGRVGGWFSGAKAKVKPPAAAIYGAGKKGVAWTSPKVKAAYAAAAPAVAAGAAKAGAAVNRAASGKVANPPFQKMRKYFLRLVGSGRGSLADLEGYLRGIFVQVENVRSEPDAARRTALASELASRIENDIDSRNGQSALNRALAQVTLVRQEVERKPFEDEDKVNRVRWAMIQVEKELRKVKGALTNCAEMLRAGSFDEASEECQFALRQSEDNLRVDSPTGPLAVVAAEIQREAEATPPSPVAEAILGGYAYARPRVEEFVSSAPGRAVAFAAAAPGRVGEAWSQADAQAGRIIYGTVSGSVKACIRELDRISGFLRGLRSEKNRDKRIWSLVSAAHDIGRFISGDGCLSRAARLLNGEEIDKIRLAGSLVNGAYNDIRADVQTSPEAWSRMSHDEKNAGIEAAVAKLSEAKAELARISVPVAAMTA